MYFLKQDSQSRLSCLLVILHMRLPTFNHWPIPGPCALSSASIPPVRLGAAACRKDIPMPRYEDALGHAQDAFT